MSSLLLGILIVLVGLPVAFILFYGFARMATLAYFHSLRDYNRLMLIDKQRDPLRGLN